EEASALRAACQGGALSCRVVAVLLLGMPLTLAAGRHAFITAVRSGQSNEELPLPTESLRWMGVGSCAAAACHGSSQARPGQWQASYTVWAEKDKHARAYQALLGKQSAQIMQNLGRHKAHLDKQCLRCHVHPGYDPANRDPYGERFAKADGV